jgi:hypothetical protein
VVLLGLSEFGGDTGIPSLEMQKTEEKPLKPTVCNHFPQCPTVTRSQSWIISDDKSEVDLATVDTVTGGTSELPHTARSLQAIQPRFNIAGKFSTRRRISSTDKTRIPRVPE